MPQLWLKRQYCYRNSWEVSKGDGMEHTQKREGKQKTVQVTGNKDRKWGKTIKGVVNTDRLSRISGNF